MPVSSLIDAHPSRVLSAPFVNAIGVPLVKLMPALLPKYQLLVSFCETETIEISNAVIRKHVLTVYPF
jgi:hypothetical protein